MVVAGANTCLLMLRESGLNTGRDERPELLDGLDYPSLAARHSKACSLRLRERHCPEDTLNLRNGDLLIYTTIDITFYENDVVVALYSDAPPLYVSFWLLEERAKAR